MMDLERLAAAVGAAEVVGRAPVEVSRPRLRRAGGRRRARCSSACAARTSTGTTSRRGGRARRGRARRRAAARRRRAAGRRPRRAGGDGARGGRVLRPTRPRSSRSPASPARAARRRRRSCSSRSSPPRDGGRGSLGTIEARVGGERRGVKRTTPEAIDLQRLFREMLDAGDRSCAMEASSHASALHRLDRVRFAALVFTNLSHDHLDFHGDMEDVLPGEAAALRRGRRPPP